jgi:hypothetical protein
LAFLEYKLDSMDFLQNFDSRYFFQNLSNLSYLTENFIIKYVDYGWDWYKLSFNIPFSLDFINKHRDKIDIECLHTNPNITLEFIKENIHSKQLDLTYWIDHPAITKDFLIQYFDSISNPSNLLYKYPDLFERYITGGKNLVYLGLRSTKLPKWSKEYHPYYHDTFKKQVKILLLLQKFRQPFNQLPKDVLYIIISSTLKIFSKIFPNFILSNILDVHVRVCVKDINQR